MKIKIQLLTICLLLIWQLPSAFSANIYILQDDDCMDRLVYAETTDGKSGEQVIYRIQASPVSYVFLEISQEDQRVQELMPPEVVTCSTGDFDEVFVEEINGNRDRAYMVMPTRDGRYAIAEVIQAAYYEDIGQRITYMSPDFHFTFNRRTGVIGDDISVNTPNAQIYFEGKMENECSGFYLFRKIAPRNDETPHTDFVLIPEVGISEVRRGLNADDAFDDMHRLEKVNTYLIGEYLRLLCDEQAQPQPMERPEIAVKGAETQPQSDELRPKTPQPQSDSQAVATNNPCGETSGGGFHIVKKGQTLYRISKMYDITVSELKRWNGLGSNLIYPCDKLRVVENLSRVKSPEETIVSDEPVVTTPPPYDEYVAARGVSSTESAWLTDDVYHIVRRGETVASIAMKYGYTEERFRKFNDLGPNEVARVGQPLRITDCPCPPIGTSSAANNSNNRRQTRTEPQNFGNAGSVGRDLTPKSPFESDYDFTNDERITPQFYMDTRATNRDVQTRRGGSILSTELQNRSGDAPRSYSDNTIPQRYEASSFKRATHVVKNDETLYEVARMYGITVERLRALNGLGPNDVVIPYQRLYIN